eukprot:3239586-Rhodomonas_salina.1
MPVQSLNTGVPGGRVLVLSSSMVLPDGRKQLVLNSRMVVPGGRVLVLCVGMVLSWVRDYQAGVCALAGRPAENLSDHRYPLHASRHLVVVIVAAAAAVVGVGGGGH